MRLVLYANDEPVGWAELVAADPSMGGASGPFRPNKNYPKIQPVIREILKYNGALGSRNDHELRKCRKKLEALHLQVKDETGRKLDTANFYLVDFAEEPGEDDGYELDIIVAGWRIFDAWFPGEREAKEDHYRKQHCER